MMNVNALTVECKRCRVQRNRIRKLQGCTYVCGVQDDRHPPVLTGRSKSACGQVPWPKCGGVFWSPGSRLVSERLDLPSMERT